MRGLPRPLLVGLVALTALRLWHAGRIGLTPDEAYYWLWSQHLDLSYFSKGPVIALAIRLSTALLGATALGVRLLSPLLALATSLLVFGLGRDLFERRAGIAAVVALNALPLFNTGALLMTIDPISIAAWLAALATAAWATRPPAGRPVGWLGVGLLVGFGLLAKPTNLALLPGLALYLALSPGRRRQLWTGLAPAVGVALAAGTPILLWNARQGWPTLRHLVARGGLDEPFRPHVGELLEFVGAHVGVYSPILLVMGLMALPAAFRRARPHDATRLLLCTSLPLVVAYLIVSLGKAGQPNWTAPGMVGVLLLGAAHWSPRVGVAGLPRRWAVAGLALGALLSLAIADTSWIRKAGVDLPPPEDPATRVRGWEETTTLVLEQREALALREGALPFLVASRYSLAAELAFHGARELAPPAPGHPTLTTRPRRPAHDQFAFWPSPWTDAAPYRGRPALYVSDWKRPPEPPPDVPADVADSFASCELLAVEPVLRADGAVLRTVVMHACTGFEPQPLAP